jgi:hypothetical protein
VYDEEQLPIKNLSAVFEVRKACETSKTIAVRASTLRQHTIPGDRVGLAVAAVDARAARTGVRHKAF